MVRYLRSANVGDGVIQLDDVKRMNFSLTEQRTFDLRDGDVLVTEGSGSRDAVGMSAVWRGELPGVVCFQNTLLRIRPRQGKSDGRFLAWWARHAHASRLMAAVASGANILHLSAEELRRLPVSNVELAAQRRIADFLDDQVARIDNIVAARRQQTSLLIEQVRALTSAALESDAERFGWAPLRWWVTSVDQGWSPQCDNVPAANGEPGVLKLSAVRDGYFDPGENKAMLTEHPDDRYRVHRGDLLVSRANTPDLVGDSAIVDTDDPNLYFPDLLYRVGMSIEEPSYACAAIRSARVRGLLRVIGRGSSLSMAKIRGEDIRALPVPAAPREVRAERSHEFGQVSEEGQKGQALQGQSIARLVELKRSLITAAVTGEFDVSSADGSRVPVA